MKSIYPLKGYLLPDTLSVLPINALLTPSTPALNVALVLLTSVASLPLMNILYPSPLTTFKATVFMPLFKTTDAFPVAIFPL